MKLQLSTFALLPLILLVTACGTLPEKEQRQIDNNNPMVVLPIATAVQIDYQDEVKLLRLNQLISEHKGEKQQKALLFYERGIIYDRMGLSAHSRYDFTQSINTFPAFPEAYNSLGVYLLLAQSYDEAFDAFDAALELSDKMQYSYLHRAIGLYHVKRYPLASRDINKFYQLDKNDPYRTLWRYVIDSKIDEATALADLQMQAITTEDNRYAWTIVDVIAERTTEKEFFESISQGVNSNKQMAERLCEAYFYLGYWHKLAGNLDKAIYYFKLATTTNIHEFIEYKYALMELASIQKELAQSSGG
ncbi:lipoprotein NlpI [Psychromonas sp. psych-6C06]|uniref:lipoprotein NlpI n=1 Tax=Psychromonas sp. psych-6C06 TaxID=2058089 RepID=UPI000C32AFE2|nr:lipoprotein NlpI [Psychromonas sp. psych-6C06]PKF60600.1 lipoprotein NlpI [Psychromonas sp. psych-6C06]